MTGGGLSLHSMGYSQTSQPQNTENLETDVKKSGDFSKNLEIDRLTDKNQKTQVLINRKCFLGLY